MSTEQSGRSGRPDTFVVVIAFAPALLIVGIVMIVFGALVFRTAGEFFDVNERVARWMSDEPLGTGRDRADHVRMLRMAACIMGLFGVVTIIAALAV